MVDEQSLRNAIYEAIDVWRNRQNYDEPMQHPLPKLYHEKRDESEKVRFRSSADDKPKTPKDPKAPKDSKDSKDSKESMEN
jgi:4-hydroxythreonine-4-phosphate dehydrogenase